MQITTAAVSSCSEDSISQHSSPSSESYVLPLLLCPWALVVMGGYRCPLRAEYPGTHSPISPLTTTPHKEDQHWETAQVHGYKCKYLEDNLTARSLSKISIVGSALVSTIPLSMGFWPAFQYQMWISLLWSKFQVQLETCQWSPQQPCHYCTGGHSLPGRLVIAACRFQWGVSSSFPAFPSNVKAS